MAAVAVVTDSTASLPAALVEAAGVVVVPLTVVVDGEAFREGVDLSPARLVDALRSGATVTTSQPGPEAFARAYARLAARGAREIVSVHLSGELSGTVTSAGLAAQGAGVPVHVVDSRSVGMGLGFAALAAARVAGGGASAAGGVVGVAPEAAAPTGDDSRPSVQALLGAAAARAAERSAAGSTVLFAVDSLEQLRRGGRLGPVAAALGGVLGLRPVLGLRSGRLEVVEKVRTSARARERIVETALADAAGRDGCEIAVHHLGPGDVAQTVAQRLADAPGVRAVHVAEVSAAVGAHVGPGLLAVVVAG